MVGDETDRDLGSALLIQGRNEGERIRLLLEWINKLGVEHTLVFRRFRHALARVRVDHTGEG